MKTEKSTSTASEIISDLTKQLNTVDGDLEFILEEIRNTKAIFHAVQFACDEGAICGQEMSQCFSALMRVLSVLENSAENLFGLSSSFLKGVL